MLTYLKRSFSGILITFFLIISLLVINLFQLLSLVLFTFSKQKFYCFNRFCAKLWWGSLVFSIKNLQGVKIIYSGDFIPANENALIISNHRGLTDVLFILCLAQECNRLSDLKWFVKDVLKFVPGVGWGLWFLGNLFVKRNWTADRNSIESTFHVIKHLRIPIWLISFLEGTRLTQKKFLDSQEYAKRQGIYPLRHLLIPRTKGFVASISGLEDHLEAIYDITLGYIGTVPTIGDIITGHLNPVHLHVRRFPVSKLPKGSEALSTWAMQLYIEKDQLLDSFNLNGSFPSKKNHLDETPSR
jgi:1-acyl-sn-glycerol-3-phosphate acyltransferase